MSAPRFFSRFPLALVLLSTAAALLVAGCTVPGSSRLEGPPKDLPPSLSYVTADVLGFWLVDPDEESTRREALGDGAELVGDPLEGGITSDTSSWIGKAEGVAVRELLVDPDDVAATKLYFADVDDRDALVKALDEEGWSDTPSEPDGGGSVYVRDSGTWRAAVVHDDGVIAAESEPALATFIEAADEYAVPERKAMREFAVEARKRSPVAFVFRADLVRTQVRRPFEDDPALLEFARWATDSNVLIALRDGWLGLAPAANEADRDERVRVVGASEWVPDLAPDITLGAADPALLEELGPDVDVAVALDDPGQHLRELVRAITIGAGQYVTAQDVADEDDRLELLPILDDLDGAAAIGWQDGALTIVTEADRALGNQVDAALDHAGLDASRVESDGAGLIEIDPGSSAGGSNVELDVDAPFRADLSGAGKPPRAPFVWFWTRALGPAGETAGWMTFDGTDRVTVSADVELKPARDTN